MSNNYSLIDQLEEEWLEDAKIVVVSFGCTARSAKRAVRKLRRAGMSVGFLRLISLWPFPERRIKEIAQDVDAFIVAEINMGQVSREMERFVSQKVVGVNHAGGQMMSPNEIMNTIIEVANLGNGHRKRR